MDIDIGKLQKLMNQGNAHLQVPIEFQLAILGIDEATIKKLGQNNARGLDIACGNGSLVKTLREKGLDFEGIDEEAPDEAYFIRQNIYGMKPMRGSIPRADDSYGLVLSFQNIILNRGFTLGGVLRDPSLIGGSEIYREDHTDRLIKSQYIIYEGTRVLQPQERFVCYPQLKRIDDIMGSLLRMQGIDFFHESVDRNVVRDYIKWENETTLGTQMNFDDKFYNDWGLFNRTVLTKR